MTEQDGQTPAAPDPVADLVQSALAVCLALTDGLAAGEGCRLCAGGGDVRHAAGCLLAAFLDRLESVATQDTPAGPLRYLVMPVFRAGEAETVAKAALRLERLGRELQEAGQRLHTAMETATHHLFREQARRATHNRDLQAHWAVRPLYPVNPLAGEENALLAKRRRMAKEARG